MCNSRRETPSADNTVIKVDAKVDRLDMLFCSCDFDRVGLVCYCYGEENKPFCLNA